MASNHRRQRFYVIRRHGSLTGCVYDEQKSHLVQSTDGFEHYYQKLPPQIRSQFRVHCVRGQTSMDERDWATAVEEWERCRALLRNAKRSLHWYTYNWLLVWVDTPLGELYQFRLRIVGEKSVAIRAEIEDCTAFVERGPLPFYRQSIILHCCGAMYEWGSALALSEHHDDSASAKELMEIAIKRYGDCEHALCEALAMLHKSYGNYKDALRWIREAQRAWDQKFPGKKNYGHLVVEAEVLEELEDIEKAIQILKEVGRAIDLAEASGTEYVDLMVDTDQGLQPSNRMGVHLELESCYRKMCQRALASGDPVTAKKYEEMADWESQAAAKLDDEADRMIMRTAETESENYLQNHEVEKAVACLVTCLTQLKSSKSILQGLICFKLSKCFETMYLQSIHGGLPNAEDHFLTAVQYLEQCIELTEHTYFKAYHHHEIAKLYNLMETRKLKAFQDEITSSRLSSQRQGLHSDESATTLTSTTQNQSPESSNSKRILRRPNVNIWRPRVSLTFQQGGFHCRRHLRIARILPAPALRADRPPMISDLDSYLNRSSALEFHAQNAALLYAELLYTLEEHSESWVSVLEQHKHVYSLLQEHYIRMGYYAIARGMESNRDSPMGRTAEAQLQNQLDLVRSCTKRAFLWAERSRTRALLFQLGPSKLSPLAAKKLYDFDSQDDVAWKVLTSSRASCGERTVFLEYSASAVRLNAWNIYVMIQDGRVLQGWSEEGDRVVALDVRLERLRHHLSKAWPATIVSDEAGVERAYDDNDMIADLEYLHQLLIDPIAEFLVGMKPEDKLIITPHELLTNVPFTALRDSRCPVGQGYLIQRHTISVTPSLRVLEHCKERLEHLEKIGPPSNMDKGTIVAVGDPAYGLNPKRLKGSGKEVNFIEELFGGKHVVKVLGTDATPAQVLKWAKYPSEHNVKQVVFHIGAHGKVDAKNFSKGALILARPNAQPYPPDMESATQSPVNSIGSKGNRDAADFEVKNVVQNIQNHASLLDAQDPDIPNGEDDDDGVEMKVQNSTLLENENIPEEASKSMTFGEVGGIKRGLTVRVGKYSAELKAENISGCGFEWRAHMVVLSACDTSRGEIRAEGVLNLPRALMVAGVPCIMVSQWQVGDDSTCELMEGFYTNMRNGKDVASALRASMLKMLNNKKHRVHDWAPFVVCGLPTVRLPLELQAPQKPGIGLRRSLRLRKILLGLALVTTLLLSLDRLSEVKKYVINTVLHQMTRHL